MLGFLNTGITAIERDGRLSKYKAVLYDIVDSQILHAENRPF